jgi:hypothetical protein
MSGRAHDRVATRKTYGFVPVPLASNALLKDARTSSLPLLRVARLSEKWIEAQEDGKVHSLIPVT